MILTGRNFNAVLILLFLLLPFGRLHGQFHAQRTNHLKANSNWFFGDLGLNLNAAPPQVIQTNRFLALMRLQEYEYDFSTRERGKRFPNVIPVSDPQSGAFRFLATRLSLYDKNLDPMLNSDFDPDIFNSQSEKCIAVAPFTHDPNKYFLFSLSPTDGLFYSVVDMTLNNGLGAVVAATKNTPVGKSSYNNVAAEIVDVVPGNNCDLWLLLAEDGRDAKTYKILAYNISVSGLNPVPVVSTFDKENEDDVFWDYKTSPARDLIAFISFKYFIDGEYKPTAEVNFLKFNADNGSVTGSPLGPIELDNPGMDIHGSFTPDNIGYIAYTNRYENGKAIFYKYDLGDNLRKTDIEYGPLPYITFDPAKHSTYFAPIIFLKPYNNELFFNIPESFTTPDPFEPSLMRVYPYSTVRLGIMKPGSNASWQQVAFNPAIPLLRNCRLYTNTDVAYPYLPVDTIPSTYFDTVFCRDPSIPFQEVTLKARPGFSNHVWYDGTTGDEHRITAPGKYWVYYKGDCSERVDTFSYRLRAPVQVLPADTVICEQRFPTQISAEKGGQYLWDDRSVLQQRTINAPGTYWVTFQAEGCTQYDTIVVDSKYCPCSIALPNAFSPNNDGLNDYFKPLIALGCVPSQYSLRIFNRWGQLMYKSNNEFDAGWNGTFGGNNADAGTYFYELRFKTRALEEENYYTKGELILIR